MKDQRNGSQSMHGTQSTGHEEAGPREGALVVTRPPHFSEASETKVVLHGVDTLDLGLFIVWNRDRRQRMASLKVESEGNTVIVREGDVVGGMSVASIHPEAVDFRWMQRTFRIYTGRF